MKKCHDAYNHFLSITFKQGTMYLLSELELVPGYRYAIQLNDYYAYFELCGTAEETSTDMQFSVLQWIMPERAAALLVYKLTCITKTPPTKNDIFINMPQAYVTLSTFARGPHKLQDNLGMV